MAYDSRDLGFTRLRFSHNDLPSHTFAELIKRLTGMSYTPTPNTPAGVFYNVLASCLFAAMYAYAPLLEPLSGEQIYGWRILMTIPCMTLLVILTGHWHEVVDLGKRLRHQGLFWLQRLCSSALLSIQLWLFLWAPVNGYALDVSLGYFLLPITMVILGRLVFHERLSRLQSIACTLAVSGVVYQLLLTQSISWATLMVCLGYPVYFWLRRHTQTNTLGSTWLDMTLSLPVSLFFILLHSDPIPMNAPASLPWRIIGLGLLSALALGFHAMSAPRLNVMMFGLLSYVEPVLLVLVSLWIGESITTEQWPTYIAIWLAVCVLILEGAQAIVKNRRRARPQKKPRTS